MIPMLRSSPSIQKYTPATAIGAVGVLFAFGMQYDIFAIAAAAVLVPVAAAALCLLSDWRIRSIYNVDQITLTLVGKSVRSLTEKHGLDSKARRSLSRYLTERARPLLAVEIAEFLKMRDENAEPVRGLERHEVAVVSLEFLTVIYVGLPFLLMFKTAYYAAYGYLVPFDVVGFFGLFTIGVVFLIALASERVSYRRSVREHIPLLMAAADYLDSDYWTRFRAQVVEQRQTLGPTLSGEFAAKADARLELAKRGDFEKALVEKAASEDAGVHASSVDGVLEAAIVAERTPSVLSRASRDLTLLLVAGTAIGAVFAVFAASESISFGLSVGLVVATAVAALVQFAITRTIEDRNMRMTRIRRLQTRINLLYGPLLPVTRALLDRSDGGNLERFSRHMNRELGGDHRRFALPATLEAYAKRGSDGLTEREWAENLARTLLSDHQRLVEEHRRLGGATGE